MKGKKPENIDEFIAQYPVEVQEKLQKIRAAIRKAAPKAEECINYGIACYKLGGKNLIFFSGAKNHTAIYPRPRGMKEELAKFKGGKGTIQFPHDKPIPLTLITKVVKHRVKESLVKVAEKK
jgi:uncharacterized protein YdhG (YjbR/CyaY superfamily)